MRSTTVLAPILAIVTATSCSTIKVGSDTEPRPVARRSAPPSGNASTAASLGIPPGHLPPPGQCRVWIPGTPPGHQPGRSRSCAKIERSAPAGSWIVYRPSQDKKVVHVRVVDERRPGIVVRLRVYDVRRGTLLREE